MKIRKRSDITPLFQIVHAGRRAGLKEAPARKLVQHSKGDITKTVSKFLNSAVGGWGKQDLRYIVDVEIITSGSLPGREGERRNDNDPETLKLDTVVNGDHETGDLGCLVGCRRMGERNFSRGLKVLRKQPPLPSLSALLPSLPSLSPFLPFCLPNFLLSTGSVNI